METRILDAEGRVVAADSANITVPNTETKILRQRLYLSIPHLWSAETPALYTCRIKLHRLDGTVLDETEEQFGIRVLSISPNSGFSVNGVPVKLRGACIHHDNGPLGAISTDFIEERRIKKLKEAGFNAIRSAHNPASPALLRACDKLGMYVMDEAFDAWTVNKANHDYALDFSAHWQEDIDSMVSTAFNHPSVIMYSVGNEIPDTGSAMGAVRGRMLAERIRELDPTRFTTNAINGVVSVMELLNNMRDQSQVPEGAQPQGDINQQMAGLGEMMRQIMALDVVADATAESFSCVDIAGYNYMDIRYRMDHEKYPNRVICGTETFPPFIAQNWKTILDCPHVIGDFTWTGWDYIGEAGVGLNKYTPPPLEYGVSAQYPCLTAMAGDISISGFRRPISYYREIVFGLRKMPYIAVQRPEHYNDTPITTPWCWSDSVSSWSWQGFEGKPVKVEVYANTPEVELRLNGQYIARKATQDYKAIFDTIYLPGTLEAISIRDGQAGESFSLHSTQGNPQLRLETESAQVRFPGDWIYLNAYITDDQGRLFVNQDRKINVRIEGTAKLVALGSDDPLTEENFFDTTRTTCEGRVLIVLRPTGIGTVTVCAEANGLTASLQIEIC